MTTLIIQTRCQQSKENKFNTYCGARIFLLPKHKNSSPSASGKRTEDVEDNNCNYEEKKCTKKQCLQFMSWSEWFACSGEKKT